MAINKKRKYNSSPNFYIFDFHIYQTPHFIFSMHLAKSKHFLADFTHISYNPTSICVSTEYNAEQTENNIYNHEKISSVREN